ncbi:MAG: hypothetical protein Q8O88_02760 [bacterium]|nr:hypothetical protein [bacterium]
MTLIITNCRIFGDLRNVKNLYEVRRLDLTSDDFLFRKFDSSGIFISASDDEHVSTACYFDDRAIFSRLFLIKDDKYSPESIPSSQLCYTWAEDLKLIELPESGIINDWVVFKAFLDDLSDDYPVILWWH